MEEANTMSAAVDAVVRRTGRLDRRTDIVAWVRGIIRELQVQAFFEADFYEDQFIANNDPYTWSEPQWFRQMRTVSYPHLFDPQGNVIYPRFKMPGRQVNQGLAQDRYIYYKAQDYFVFLGQSGAMTPGVMLQTPGPHEFPINVGYYRYAPGLAYYLSTEENGNTPARPAQYDILLQAWTYNTVNGIDYNATTELQETARNLVTNWVLFRWYDVVVEGTSSRVFAAYNDQRNRQSYATYLVGKADIKRGEARAAMAGEI